MLFSRFPGDCWAARAWVTGRAAAPPLSLKKCGGGYVVHSYMYLYVNVKTFSVAFRSFWFDPETKIPLVFFTVRLTYSEVRVVMSYVVALGARP